MNFDELYITPVESLKTPQEARIFINFLMSEVLRHAEDIYNAMEKIKKIKEIWGL